MTQTPEEALALFRCRLNDHNVYAIAAYVAEVEIQQIKPNYDHRQNAPFLLFPLLFPKGDLDKEIARILRYNPSQSTLAKS